ncbi:hypothetical protein DFH08DRAFT_957481 [Mycena albidolilacea]|uniref:Uncharacterized protein n=1 Tax=Mycena albidolilacea TaxID=1033008 RepID=A0AAD7AAL0_9AGAR|nr:hypothetical protein DFH08DRAFT_957481 [Mycena albidolilacea]
MTPASELAADLALTALPALVSCLRKYDEEIFALQVRYDCLEEEVARQGYREKEKAKDASLKRKTTMYIWSVTVGWGALAQGADVAVAVVGGYLTRKVSAAMAKGKGRRNFNSKRRGRFFSNEEMRSTANF